MIQLFRNFTKAKHAKTIAQFSWSWCLTLSMFYTGLGAGLFLGFVGLVVLNPASRWVLYFGLASSVCTVASAFYFGRARRRSADLEAKSKEEHRLWFGLADYFDRKVISMEEWRCGRSDGGNE